MALPAKNMPAMATATVTPDTTTAWPDDTLLALWHGVTLLREH